VGCNANGNATVTHGNAAEEIREDKSRVEQNKTREGGEVMYINLFVLGILATLSVESIIIIVVAVFMSKKNADEVKNADKKNQ
jgi:hypothetical protein